MDKKIYAHAGLAVSPRVLGSEYVDRGLPMPMISPSAPEFVTEYCWAPVWTSTRHPPKKKKKKPSSARRASC